MADQENPFKLEDNDDSGFVGVGLEYQNYASDTEKPILTEEDQKLLERLEPDTKFVKADGSDSDSKTATQGAPSDSPESPSPAAPKAPAPKSTEK